jgi:hypothetical protein
LVFQGNVPAQVWSAYLSSGQEPFAQPQRTDYYLRLPTQVDLGIKVRQGAVEIKQRTCAYNIHHFTPQASGQISSWLKWRFELTSTSLALFREALSPLHWIAIRKKRWLRRYAVYATKQLSEVTENFLPDQGCEWELSQIQPEGHRASWWSLAFESFGPRQNLRENLIQVAEYALTTDLGHFCVPQNSYSYPSWLSSLLSRR